MSPGTVEIGRSGIVTGGRERPLLSGSFHYWRSDPLSWRDTLIKIKSMGFKVVCTYIPWSVHEIKRKQFDFGAHDPRKDLSRFIATVAKEEMQLLARPGPHINSELSDFGYPWRILEDPEIAARTNRGLTAGWHFPLPSYGSEKFYNEVEIYFDALAPILAAALYPKGPLIALQADNEMGYFFTDDRPYGLDYHPDAIAQYRFWLAGRYGGNIQELNRLYGTRYTGFEAVQPPRSFRAEEAGEMAPYLDWVAYKEYQIAWSLNRLAGMWRTRGLKGIPIYHNTAYQIEPPCNHLATAFTAHIDLVGLDAYLKKEDARRMERTVLYLSGTARLPFIPEFGSGIWCTRFQDTPMLMEEDLEFQSLYALMKGLKAVNYYMLVDRDRWVGAPITNGGRIREGFHRILKNVNDLMGPRGLFRYRREPRDLLLHSWDYLRCLNAACPLDLHKFGPLRLHEALYDPAPIRGLSRDQEVAAWHADVAAWLKRKRLPFDLGDSQLPLSRLIRYDRVYMASGGILDREAAARLASFVRNGGRLFLGPGAPAFDERGQPAPELAWMKDHTASPATIRNALRRVSGLKEFVTVTPPRLEVEVHRGRDGKRALFLANPAGRCVKGSVAFADPVRVRELIRGRGLRRERARRLSLSLAPFTVKVFLTEPPKGGVP